MEAFDIERLIGAPAYLNVVHAEKDGNTFANVETVMPLPKSIPAPVVLDYVRMKDRPADDGLKSKHRTGGNAPKPAPATQIPPPVTSGETYHTTDSDVPF
jgi:hypothetical protein